jgi:hypothetical protein
MEGYRLYTVVPRLVSFVDDLTNVYVRYNRKRLKVRGGWCLVPSCTGHMACPHPPLPQAGLEAEM